MVTYISLHRGENVNSAQVIGISADPELVAYVAAALLRQPHYAASDDPVLGALNRGRRRALRVLQNSKEGATNG